MRKRISLAVVISLLLLTAIFLWIAVAQPPPIFVKEPGKKPEARYVPEEIIVKFKPGVSDEVIRDLNRRHGCSVLSISRFAGFKRLRISKGKTVEEMVEIYSKNPNVDYAEPNYIAYTLWIPNDGYYHYQWHMDNHVYGGINMESAWDVQTGKPEVIVAVIDTGVAYENYGKKFKLAPDLANTSFVAGHDFVNNDTHPNDDEGHGTHVTGTIAQSTDNGIGVAGVAFNTSVMPVKVLNSAGSGTYADVAEGIRFAADNGADVINMSLGGTSPSNTLKNALAHAYGKGVVIVCAAGNNGRNGAPLYPAAYDDYCIAVGATRYDEERANYSNTGAYLDLTAPGGDIYEDQNGDGYGDGVLQQTFGSSPGDFGYWFYQGTSMASPHVAGVAALLLANGITGPDNVRKALESTAEDKGAPGWDDEYGWGIVDANAASHYTAEPTHDVAVTDVAASSWSIQGDTVDIAVTVANQGGFNETFTVTLTDITDTYTVGSMPVSLQAGESTSLSFSWDTTTSSLGDHILEAEASPVDGEINTDNNSMTATVTVKESANDVAVTAIDAPSQAPKGDMVTIKVAIENQGTYKEITTVTLTDTTDSVEIGSNSVALAVGALTIESFSWDTTNSSTDDHILEAKASFVAGETDTADNSMTTPVRIVQPSTIYVSGIDMGLSTRTAGKNTFTKALATVTVVDADNNPVEGATVYGSWSSATANTDSGVTDSAGGEVTLASGAVKNPSSGTTFTFTVDDVAKSGWNYDPAANVEISDSITVE